MLRTVPSFWRESVSAEFMTIQWCLTSNLWSLFHGFRHPDPFVEAAAFPSTSECWWILFTRWPFVSSCVWPYLSVRTCTCWHTHICVYVQYIFTCITAAACNFSCIFRSLYCTAYKNTWRNKYATACCWNTCTCRFSHLIGNEDTLLESSLYLLRGVCE